MAHGAGFLYVPREILDWFPGDELTRAVYLELCLRANWADAKAPLPRQKVPLLRGQCVVAERELAGGFRVSRMVIRRVLEALQRRSKISPLKSPHGTVITICDYDALFGKDADGEPTQKPTSSPQVAHNEPNQKQEEQGKQENKEDSMMCATDDPRQLMELWNKHRAGSMGAVREMRRNTTRWRHAQARMRERSLDDWHKVMLKVAASSFCRGECAPREGFSPWAASFDWLIKPDTAAKVLEGKYDDRVVKSELDRFLESMAPHDPQ